MHEGRAAAARRRRRAFATPARTTARRSARAPSATLAALVNAPGGRTLKRDRSPISRERRHHLRAALGLAAAIYGADARLRHPRLARKFELDFARRPPTSRDASKECYPLGADAAVHRDGLLDEVDGARPRGARVVLLELLRGVEGELRVEGRGHWARRAWTSWRERRESWRPRR